jgi:hypothetical protein
MTEDVPDMLQHPVGSELQPLVFISHDVRDAALAAAFAKLVSSVSAGILKTFHSSDRRPQQGFEFGVEWYPELMARLSSACDVVCLLTTRSLERPWILYEAGVAKGKHDIKVHGLALGIPLSKAGKGPFQQFQNCDGTTESVVKLIEQLLRRLPNADPDRELLTTQVEAFRVTVESILSELPDAGDDLLEDHDPSVAKLFEEVKVMFDDLPSRLHGRDVGGRHRLRRTRIALNELEDLLRLIAGVDRGGRAIAVLVCVSLIRDDTPWLYEMGCELYRASLRGQPAVERRAYRRFMVAAEFAAMAPPGFAVSREAQALLRELPLLLHRLAPSQDHSAAA